MNNHTLTTDQNITLKHYPTLAGTFRTQITSLLSSLTDSIHICLNNIPTSRIGDVIALHGEYLVENPDHKQNMVLESIRLNPDSKQWEFIFTDTRLGIEEWKFELSQLEVMDVINLLETLESFIAL